MPLGRLFDKLKTAPLGLNAKLTVLTSLSQTSRKYQDVMMVVMTNELKNEGSLLERFLLEGFKHHVVGLNLLENYASILPVP